MKRSLYIFFCAFFSIQVSYGMLQKRPCNKQTISNNPIRNLPTECLTQLQIQVEKIPQLKICLCEKTSLVKTREIISSTSSREFNAKCSANQQLFIRFFELPQEIAHLIIKDICENNPQLINNFSTNPVKMLEYRSLMQDKLHNDTRLASMVSLSELYLTPKEAIIALFDLTKHFKLTPTKAFVLDQQTIAHLCNVKQEIVSCDYFNDKLVMLKPSDDKDVCDFFLRYSFAEFINHPNHMHNIIYNIKFCVYKSKNKADPIGSLPDTIRLEKNNQLIKEGYRHIKENNRHIKKCDRQIKKCDRLIKENDRLIKENNRHIKENN